ncbi:hypothetical protein Vadar_016322 [Vaccinium darrowii]|uniref:Uncharacterized protein n=1 Tax=Vaccinium darrowii TaxID=229202 RepID=A0ACB7XR28_9ERIC|nr:hypothetical protein Vadar_016322 [Vaccinium darrowii]
MPGLAQTNNESQLFSNGAAASFYSLPCSNGSVANGFWSKHRNDVSYNQLQKFWGDLSAQARHELLRIDKQTLFEQARKNTYCSRCNGLLLEGFLQIVIYGKSLQQEGASGCLLWNSQVALKNQDGDGDLGVTMACQDEVQDPSVHPWGGLTTTRDGTLTLLDCYLHSKSLKGLQIVFDSARARERERELLYPDACGGGGRGWISQGMMGYGRGHGARETCALHTARLSVDTLVDFWSALGEETRQSLLRMKEEDFIERLMYRFDSKRFCRDCRRNVIREFKELKELKRMRREPRCTNWFCVADTAFQYEVSHNTVQADWHQTFKDNVAKFHYFEWAVGTGEGKSDILEFENVGTTGRVQVDGLDLGGLNACYITLRAWKIDGRCTELCVKAHALKGQQCVHCRLVVGDGFVTINRGESIRRFFEHAEEAEEEEDDDSMDKDGNDIDGECSRPQKHAKSPELAREFLLDAATVIFKEQVEKAFREGTARQNSHSIFVCLALKLLEERVHVACKEIITLEKQIKLLEEEEREKREEEERKERRRTKEREKKLRRKERLRGKEIDREKKSSESYQSPVVADVPREELSPPFDEQPNFFNRDSICETGDILSPYAQDEQLSNESIISYMENHSDDILDGEFSNANDEDGSFANDRSKVFHRKPKYRKGFQPDPTLKWSDRRQFAVVSESGGMVSKSEHRHHGDNFDFSSRIVNGINKQSRYSDSTKSISNGGPKFGERFHCANGRMSERCDFRDCSCDQHNDYRTKVETNASMRVRRETKSVCQSEYAFDLSKPYYRGNINKYNQPDYIRENCGRPKSKNTTGKNPFIRDMHYVKKVWEPLDSQRKYARSNSDTDVTLQSSGAICSDDAAEKLDETTHKQKNVEEPRKSTQNGLHLEAKAPRNSNEAVDEESELCSVTNSPLSGTCDPSTSTSNSDNCSSCLSEGDSNITSSNSANPESMSSSDSEDGREPSVCSENNVTDSHKAEMEKKQIAKEEGEALRNGTSSGYSPQNGKSDIPLNFPQKKSENLENGRTNVGVCSQHHQVVIPPMHNQGGIAFPVFQGPSTVGYFHQSPVSWGAAAPANGLMPFPHPNHHYVFSNPFGFGMNGNSPFMQYDSLQHFTPPLLNPCPVPIYQPVFRTHGPNSKDQPKISKPGGFHESFNEPKIERAVPAGQCLTEEMPVGDGEQNGNSEKSPEGNSGFSLFHFGGPVALSTGESNSAPPKDGTTGIRPLDLAVEHVQGDGCDEKDAVEEYNLFAASNGIQFSFF